MSNQLPNPEADIHPWMPRCLHDGKVHYGDRLAVGRISPLGRMCAELGISIHDREAVYEWMKHCKKLP